MACMWAHGYLALGDRPLTMQELFCHCQERKESYYCTCSSWSTSSPRPAIQSHQWHWPKFTPLLAATGPSLAPSQQTQSPSECWQPHPSTWWPYMDPTTPMYKTQMREYMGQYHAGKKIKRMAMRQGKHCLKKKCAFTPISNFFAMFFCELSLTHVLIFLQELWWDDQRPTPTCFSTSRGHCTSVETNIQCPQPSSPIYKSDKDITIIHSPVTTVDPTLERCRLRGHDLHLHPGCVVQLEQSTGHSWPICAYCSNSKFNDIRHRHWSGWQLICPKCYNSLDCPWNILYLLSIVGLDILHVWHFKPVWLHIYVLSSVGLDIWHFVTF